MSIITEFLRAAPYAEVLDAQRTRHQAMVARKRAGMPVEREWLMMVEHTPVYTLGRHAMASNVINPAMIAHRGARVVEIERGGDVTFHGPGQVVAYPLIDLERHHLGVKSYVALLEQAVIDTLACWGITAGRVEGATGVWIDGDTLRARKVCAIGIKCSRHCTMHGLALNVTTDLSWFSAINPCGFTDRGVTSMAAETGAPIAWEDVASRLALSLEALLEDAAGRGD